MFYTPRFSYSVSKVTVRGVVQECSTGVHVVREGSAGRVGIQGGYTGWGTRVAIPGTTPAPREEVLNQRSGPRKPQGAGVGGFRAGRVSLGVRRRGRPCTHPPDPVGLPGALPGAGPLRMPPLGLYGRELTSFPVKLAKTAECHREVSKRPVIVPISKTAS